MPSAPSPPSTPSKNRRVRPASGAHSDAYTTSPGWAVGASRETIHRCPSGSTTTPPRPYGASVTGRSSTAPAATAAATTPSGSAVSSRNDWLAPPRPTGARRPISGNSSASMRTVSPIPTSTWPIRPSGIT